MLFERGGKEPRTEQKALAHWLWFRPRPLPSSHSQQGQLAPTPQIRDEVAACAMVQHWPFALEREKKTHTMGSSVGGGGKNSKDTWDRNAVGSVGRGVMKRAERPMEKGIQHIHYLFKTTIKKLIPQTPIS